MVLLVTEVNSKKIANSSPEEAEVHRALPCILYPHYMGFLENVQTNRSMDIYTRRSLKEAAILPLFTSRPNSSKKAGLLAYLLFIIKESICMYSNQHIQNATPDFF